MLTSIVATPIKMGGRILDQLNQEWILAFVLVAISAIVTLMNPRFLSEQNVSDVLTNSSYLAVAAIGAAIVILAGHIDISVGSLIGLLATLSGQLALGAAEGNYPLWLAFILPIFAGMLVGAVNGFLVAYLRIPSIVVTLGMLSILKGGLILWTSGEWIYNLPDSYQFAQESIFGIRVPIYFMFGIMLITGFWLRYTNSGRAVYAVGGNKQAAKLTGISERNVVMSVFVINGALVGIASLIYATQFNAIQSTAPAGLELLIISGAVIGGVSILGGSGTVIGAVLGTILLRTIDSAMIFAQVPQYWLMAVQGVLILVTVSLDIMRRNRQLQL